MRNSYQQPYYDDDDYYDDDEMYAPPKRNPTPRRRQTWLRSTADALMKNPKRLVWGALFFGIALLISLNALVMQTSRHPAPIFAPTVEQAAAPTAPLPPPAPPVEARDTVPPTSVPPTSVAAQPQAQPPVPSARTEAQRGDAIGDIIRTGSTAPAAPARVQQRQAALPQPTPTQMRQPPQPPQRRDAIADLIRSNGPTAAARPPERNAVATQSTVTDAQKRLVMAGQQALNKLGYGPLNADGVAGSDTQKALRKFEFDRRLPVTGTFNSQTVSELSANARLAIR